MDDQFWSWVGTAALVILGIIMVLFVVGAFRLTEPVRADDDVRGGP